jgi:hypothetical protein
MNIDKVILAMKAHHDVVQANAPQSITNLRDESEPIDGLAAEVTWEFVETAVDAGILTAQEAYGGDDLVDSDVWRSLHTAARTYIELVRSLDLSEEGAS